MSEHQSYEFLALDRALSASEQSELRALSTRAEITSTSFSNEYQWGSFKGEPLEMMRRYFDVHVYWTNWGEGHLMVRVPLECFNPAQLSAYKAQGGFNYEHIKEHWILIFQNCVQDSDSMGFDDWVTKLRGVRESLLQGDLSAPYIAWLGALQHDGLHDQGDDELAPAQPVGLSALSGPLKHLAKFLCVNLKSLERSARHDPPQATPEQIRSWVAALPADLKDHYLVSTFMDASYSPRVDLLVRYGADHPLAKPGAPGVTLGELREQLGVSLGPNPWEGGSGDDEDLEEYDSGEDDSDAGWEEEEPGEDDAHHYERALAIISPSKTIWGDSYKTRMRHLQAMTGELYELLEEGAKALKQSRRLHAVQLFDGVARACWEHFEYQEECEFQEVLESALEGLGECLGEPLLEYERALALKMLREIQRSELFGHGYCMDSTSAPLLQKHLRLKECRDFAEQLADAFNNDSRAAASEKELRSYLASLVGPQKVKHYLPE